ncbi:hypothetical protein ATANTOWER_003433 [Ataeniobius toweri]|uniref:Uncharacterized protein n=1 Tax=Ataeniobius toweri TaxID=208326 RepID=A0ABU7C6A6_9TELE|nr:hypothetical protein [Ataeniobius toweri]
MLCFHTSFVLNDTQLDVGNTLIMVDPFSSTVTSFPVTVEENHPPSMMVPPLCFTVCMEVEEISCNVFLACS